MDLVPEKIKLIETLDGIQVVVGKERRVVERIARAFPRTNPDQFIGLLDPDGHEIGMIEEPERLDKLSKNLLDTKLKEIYFIPEIQEVLSITAHGTGSQWTVQTDDGEYTFRILSRDALKGDNPPSITIISETGKRFFIDNYYDLEPESRELMSRFIPDKIVKFRYYVRSMRRGSSSRGSSGMGSSGMGSSHGGSSRHGSSSGGGMMRMG
ncbi:MAG: DUF1854 domain-containing protein [bacterium]|nr:DUF1854 domain-containing protein [bacterium]